jgi:hypothetical protein
MAGEHFRGEITVAARIIDLLSSGLYESPAACLKELINNSFDADASHVDVSVKPDANRIIIQDDGQGMDRAEFERHFRRIAESHKRDNQDVTTTGRPKIGKIGIGVIAANELCERLEIFSTKAGSPELLHVTIDFEEMRKSPELRKKEDGGFLKADYIGEILETDTSSHFTHIFLTEIRGEARQILAGLEAAKRGAVPLTLYGRSVENVEKLLRTQYTNTWGDFDRYSQTILEVALNVPIQYFDRWLPSRLRKQLSLLEKQVRDLNFSVTYDGLMLRKPTVFVGDEAALVRRFSFTGKEVSAEGYFYAQHGSIKPLELQGLLTRIRNAAVGEYDHSFWGFSASEYQLIQRWVSGEIWADDRLEDAMNIDRRTLRVTHPAFVELKTRVHEELRQVFSEVRSRIYETGSESRKDAKATDALEVISTLTHSVQSELDKVTVREIGSAWKSSKENTRLRKALLRNYSVPEFYEIVLEVAKAVLSPKQRNEFLRRLTERLSRG